MKQPTPSFGAPSVFLKVSPQLYLTDLLALLQGRILALRVNPFICPESCHRWAEQFEASEEMDRYSNASDVPVDRIGMTLFETEQDPAKLAVYLRSAQTTNSLIERILGPGDNPLSALRKGLKQVWDAGCIVEQLQGRQMNPGIIRSFEAVNRGGLPPHTDTMVKDLPDCTEFDEMQVQLAANLYLNVPEQGGALEIWDFEPMGKELARLYNGTYDFIDRKKLPCEPVSIQPRVGELILFRSSCVHSVQPAAGGRRTAASCFVGFYDEARPLTVWA